MHCINILTIIKMWLLRKHFKKTSLCESFIDHNMYIVDDCRNEPPAEYMFESSKSEYKSCYIL